MDPIRTLVPFSPLRSPPPESDVKNRSGGWAGLARCLAVDVLDVPVVHKKCLARIVCGCVCVLVSQLAHSRSLPGWVSRSALAHFGWGGEVVWNGTNEP